MKREIVITGAGVVSPFGVGLSQFFDGLESGNSAVSPLQAFDAKDFPMTVAGQASASTDPAVTELRDRKIPFVLQAGQEAWTSAGGSPSQGSAWLCLGLGLERAFLEDFARYHRGEAGIDWERIYADSAAEGPRVRFRSEVDLSARLLAERLELSGPVLVNSSACAAGTMAVAQAAAWIRRGLTDRVVCGAGDSMINPLGMGGMSKLGAPSPRGTSEACRPFDRARDGLAMGEGAALFVLEEESAALARGAKPLARVLGWATTQDGYRVTAPKPDGEPARRAMQRAIDRAGLQAADIGYVNAHGTGTPLNDPAESRAIRAVFGEGDRAPLVSSIKGAVGHLMAASGALELAACLLPFARGVLPGTANHQSLDPECAGIRIIGPRPVRAEVQYVLSNSFGFGGQNASIVLGRYLP